MTVTQLFDSTRAKAIASCAVLLLALLALRLNVLPNDVEAVVRDVSNTGLNDADLEVQTRNYYREVSDVDVGRFAGMAEFAANLGLRPRSRDKVSEEEPRAIAGTSIAFREHMFLPWELRPNMEITFLGHSLKTNRWGMRDIEYDKEKPANTFRIALVGASNSMGNGVAFEDIYSEHVEKRLNEALAGKAYEKYELLNFSVGGYELSDRLYVATEKIPAFDPDLVFVVIVYRDLTHAVYQRVAERLVHHEPTHYDFIEQIIKEAGVQPGDREMKIRQRLKPYRGKLMIGIGEELKRLSERMGVPVVALVLNVFVGQDEISLYESADIMERVGVPTIRLFHAYDGAKEEDVYLELRDRHPTAYGHKLIAEEFYDLLMEHPQFGPMIRGETRKETAGNAP